MRMKRKEGRKEGKEDKKNEGRYSFTFSLSCYKFVKNLKEEKLLCLHPLFSILINAIHFVREICIFIFTRASFPVLRFLLYACIFAKQKIESCTRVQGTNKLFPQVHPRNCFIYTEFLTVDALFHLLCEEDTVKM